MDHRNKKERKRTREITTQLSSSPPSSLLEPDSSLKTRENKAGIFQIYDKFCEKKHGLMGYESLTKFLEKFQRQKVDCSGDKDVNKEDNVKNGNEDNTHEALQTVMRVSFF